MYKEIQKKLSRNWFKILQDVICNEIEILEKRSTKFTSKNWNKNSTIDEKSLIKSCGYATVTKSGEEKILFTSFYEAVLVAKGCTN